MKKASVETQQDAMAIAKATQKPGQTKEQTKLIAAGIEKGIAEYKKQQKAKARLRDKVRKQSLKSKSNCQPDDELQPDSNTPDSPQMTTSVWVLLILLIVSWVGFAAFLFY